MNLRTRPKVLRGTLAAALFGAGALTAIWATNNPIQGWVWGTSNLTVALILAHPGVLWEVALLYVIVALSFGLGGAAVYWAMTKIGRSSTTNLLIAGATICFLFWLASQVGGISTGFIPITSDAGGVVARGGVITAHGWEGILRRCVLVGALGLAMTWVFCLVAGVNRTPGDAGQDSQLE